MVFVLKEKYNMNIGSLTNVINEATIKAPERPVAGVHHSINLRDRLQKASGGLNTQQQLNALRTRGAVGQKMANIAKSGMHRALADKETTKKLLRSKFKISARPEASIADKTLKGMGY